MTSKTTFKVGDIIRRKKIHSTGSFHHDQGPFKIVAITPNDKGTTAVTLDRIPDQAILKTADGWALDYFELVEAAPVKGEFIILLNQGTKLAPATNPRSYTSEAQAKAVAAEMAEKHPGQEFLIFKAVGKAKAVAATVEMY